jgi:hypothetical protein
MFIINGLNLNFGAQRLQKKIYLLIPVFASIVLGLSNPLQAQKLPAAAVQSQPQISAQLSYADVADLAIGAPIAAQVRIRTAERIKPAPSITLPAGRIRFLITADVVALIRGSEGLPPQVRYIVDVGADAKGRPPKLRKAEMMVFGLIVPKRNGEIQLIAPDAQVPVVPGLADRVRAIILASTRADAPPRITGIGDAFHVAGSLSGQGETQIFLVTGDGRPASLSIWREPGVAARWAVSLDEIVDQGAGPPQRDTLLWYRLACFLPPALSVESAATLDPDLARIAAEDYQVVIGGLGKCGRTRG